MKLSSNESPVVSVLHLLSGYVHLIFVILSVSSLYCTFCQTMYILFSWYCLSQVCIVPSVRLYVLVISWYCLSQLFITSSVRLYTWHFLILSASFLHVTFCQAVTWWFLNIFYLKFSLYLLSGCVSVISWSYRSHVIVIPSVWLYICHFLILSASRHGHTFCHAVYLSFLYIIRLMTSYTFCQAVPW